MDGKVINLNGLTTWLPQQLAIVPVKWERSEMLQC